MKAIVNGLIYTMENEEIIEKGSILIDGGKIIKVGKNIDLPKDVEVIDAQGNLVLPGFIDAHCHLGMWEEGIGQEGSDGNEGVDPVTPHLRAIDAINPMDEAFFESYSNGVTTAVTGPGSANVIGGMFAAVKTYGKRIDDMILKDPIAMKVAFGENPKRFYSAQNTSPVTRMGSVAMLREMLLKTIDYMKRKEAADGDLTKMPKKDIKLEALIPVINKEIPIKAHAHRADDIFSALRVAKEFDLDITLDHCTEGHLIVDELKKENKPAIIGPTMTNRSKFELQNQSFETPKALNEAGLLIAITTDAPVIPLKHLSLCAGLAYKEGLSEMEALKAITINPAIITGISDRVGSIKEGKDADIVIYDKNPIKDVDFNTLLTMINGEVVYKLN